MTTTFDRFRSKYVATPGGCWTWAGSLTQGGYGSFWFDTEARQMPAHRAAWLLLVSPIPAGHDLDHLCRNRACVNPAHLEPVTRRENLMRGDTIPRAHVEGRYCGHAGCVSCRHMSVGVVSAGRPPLTLKVDMAVLVEQLVEYSYRVGGLPIRIAASPVVERGDDRLDGGGEAEGQFGGRGPDVVRDAGVHAGGQCCGVSPDLLEVLAQLHQVLRSLRGCCDATPPAGATAPAGGGGGAS